MTRPTADTLELTRRMTEVADALTAYAHLPAVDRVSVHGHGRVYAHLPYSVRHEETLAGLCAWAAAFGADVTIELSYGGSGEVKTDFAMAGHPVHMYQSLHSGQAYELGAALRQLISPDRPVITVSPAQLLAVVSPGGDLS